MTIRVTTAAEPPKERLSRERIVETALAMMADQGYDAVSMRSLARELGTGPASLYAHVAHKDELDQLVVDRIASQLDLPEPDPERWQEQLKQAMRDQLGLYRAHPGSARAALATIPTMEGGLRAAEGIMAICLAGGVPPQTAAWFCDLAALYVSAIAAEESIWVERARAAAAGGRAMDETRMVDEIRRLFAGLPPEIFPVLSANAEAMTAGDGDQRFEFGLGLLVAGLAAVSAREA